MRIKYIGRDGRTRIAEASRIKFMADTHTERDKRYEVDDFIKGPVIVMHVLRTKGGKSLVMTVPPGFNMADAEERLLEYGWLDLSDCPVQLENLY